MNLASIVNILGHVNEIHKNMDKPFIGGIKKNITKIKITSYSGNLPLNVVLDRLCYLRTARKLNDIESVNNFQLGKLKQHNVKYIKLD